MALGHAGLFCWLPRAKSAFMPYVMNTTCACPHCGQQIEFESDSADEVVPCPNCQQQVTLTVPAVKPSPSVVAVSIPARSVKAYLKILRANSCYGTLRAFVNVSFCLCVLGCFLTGVAAIVAEPPLLATSPILAVPATLLAILLLIAGRQAVFVVIDIADALIQEGNRNFK